MLGLAGVGYLGYSFRPANEQLTSAAVPALVAVSGFASAVTHDGCGEGNGVAFTVTTLRVNEALEGKIGRMNVCKSNDTEWLSGEIDWGDGTASAIEPGDFKGKDEGALLATKHTYTKRGAFPVFARIRARCFDHGQSDAPGVHSGANYAGAEGPMQFEPATFAEYAVDADHTGKPDIYDPADAIYTAAAMLCANGAASGTPAGIKQAIFTYNHSAAYVTDVLAWAARYTTPAAGHGGRVRPAAGRQALPLGRHRPGRLRLLRPGLRRLRRRRHPHRAHHLRLAPGRTADPAARHSAW